MAVNRPLVSALAAVVALGVAACKGSTPVAPPPVVNNTAPTIESIAISGIRAEADRDIQLEASVKDAETPIDQLTYTWSATPHNGVFTGSGPMVTWRAPKGQKTPDLYTIQLTVTEGFTSAGQAKQNVVSSTQTVHYNDSPAELEFLAIDFLVDKFGNYEVSPAEAVSNFHDSCSGKAAEFSDVTLNRERFRILSATYSLHSIAFDEERTRATVKGECVFDDIDLSVGRRELVVGICTLENVYKTFQWFLCRSTFRSTSKTWLTVQPGRVPGQIVSE